MTATITQLLDKDGGKIYPISKANATFTSDGKTVEAKLKELADAESSLDPSKLSGIVPVEKGGTGNATGEAQSAKKLSTGQEISISDSDGTNTGAAVAFDGSEAVTLKLPSTIGADITGNAATATTATTAETATKADTADEATAAGKLKSAVTINIQDTAEEPNVGKATSFDGSAGVVITLPAKIHADIEGKADSAKTADTATSATSAETAEMATSALSADKVTNKLTFTGGATGEFDGSEALSIAIPKAPKEATTDEAGLLSATDKSKLDSLPALDASKAIAFIDTSIKFETEEIPLESIQAALAAAG